MTATFAVPDCVRDILARSTIKETSVVLPAGQLDRDTYEAVNKVLAAAGGKWNRSAKAHLFKRDPRGLLCAAIDQGTATNVQKKLQAFYTPAPLAKRIVEMADIQPGMTVLEPSAGEGAIADEAALAGGDVTCVEIDPVACEVLRDSGHAVLQQDFLALAPQPFDRVAANPPFTGGQDIAHIQHAFRFLRDCGKLVAVCSPGFTYRQQSKWTAFRAFVEQHGEWEALPAGSFSESGTEVSTVIVTLWKPS